MRSDPCICREKRIAFRAIALLLAQAVATACHDSSETKPQPVGLDRFTSQSEKSRIDESFDFGNIHLQDGRASLTHSFEFRNDSDTPIKVVKVAKTCGCIRCEISDEELEPGETAVVTVGMDVVSSGPASHGVTLLLSNDTAKSYSVRAYGIIDEEFRAVVEFPQLDAETKTLPLRLYLIDSTGNGESEPPEIVAPLEARLQCDEWIVLESREMLSLRPTRQLLNCTLDLSQYAGPFPVEARIRTARGRECRVSIFSP